MMMAITMLVQKFEFKFAEGFDWKGWPDRHIDMFVTFSDPLRVKVESRS